MSSNEYYNTINNLLFKDYDFKNLKINKLILAMTYSLKLLDESDYKIWLISESILSKYTCDKGLINKFKILMSSIFILYSSYLITYSQPGLLNKKFINKKICLHILFGENISQLTSLILSSEAFLLIDKNIKDDKEKNEWVHFLNGELNDIVEKSNLILHLENYSKSDIEKDYQDIHYIFFKISIKIVYKLLQLDINKKCKEENIKKLYRLSYNISV
jgi:hypothetical protein